MTRIIRPGRTPLDYFGTAEPEPERTQYPARPGRPRPVARPGYTPPVRHSHGSRRQERYEQVDERTAIAESMTVGSLLDERAERIRREREAEAERRERWIADVEANRARANARSLMAYLRNDTPAKPHVTPHHRVAVHELAREAGMTSAQMLVIVNKQFGEYAKCASSTIATIVADDIRAWLLLPTSAETIDAVRNGTF